MCVKKNSICRLLIMACCIAFILATFQQISGQTRRNPRKPPSPPSGKPGDEESKVESVLSLKVTKGKLLTLHAVNASLKSVVQRIGAKLKIEVVAYLNDEETISHDFEELDIIKTIGELSEFANFIYYKDAKTGKVKKIVVTPKSQR